MIGSLTSVAMTEKMGGIGAVLETELDLARNLDPDTRLVILVEGESDRRAIETLARRYGRNLHRVAVLAITGATNVDRFLEILGERDIELVGMCDEAELDAFQSAFNRAGRSDVVYSCVIDLEDELIRALGVPRMLEVIAEQEELRAFHSFQNQPDQRHKPTERQMWRWLGNRKIRYASVLVNALDPDRVPAPLAGALAAIPDSCGPEWLT